MSSMLEENSRVAEQPKEITVHLNTVYFDFFIFLKQERKQKQDPISHTVILKLPFNQMKVDVTLNFAIKRSGEGKVALKLEYSLDSIGGQPIRNFTQRTRIELCNMATLLNTHLQKRKSNFQAHCNKRNAFIFRFIQNNWLINDYGRPEQELKRIKQSLQDGHKQFMNLFSEFNKINLLIKPNQQQYNTFDDMLKRFYIDRKDVGIDGSGKTIDQCLRLMIDKIKMQIQTESSKDQVNTQFANQNPGLREEWQSNSFIAQSILIKDDTIHPLTGRVSTFRANLQTNNLQDRGSLTLKCVKFIPCGTFGPNRRRNFPNSYNYQDIINMPGKEQHEQHLIFKKCLNTMVNSKEMVGHRNQHNFMEFMAGKKSPYICPLYEDKNEENIDIIQRSIISKCADGDLFTEVVSKSYRRQVWHSSFNQQIYCCYPFKSYLRFFEQMVLAINFLHINDVVHRDIKPPNVLVEYRNSEYRNFGCRNSEYRNSGLLLRLIDFGSVHIKDHPAYREIEEEVLCMTAGFCMTFQMAQKITDNRIGKHYTKGKYNTHKQFDIYSLAKTMEYLLKFSVYSSKSQLLNQTLLICQEVQPDSRLTTQELKKIILELRIREQKQLYHQSMTLAYQYYH